MLTPAQHYARADELLEEAATVRGAASTGWTTDPRPSEELGTGALRAWERRRNDRVGRLTEASRLVDAAQAHATLATVVPVDAERMADVIAALQQWAATPPYPLASADGTGEVARAYVLGHGDASREDRRAVTAILAHATEVPAR